MTGLVARVRSKIASCLLLALSVSIAVVLIRSYFVSDVLVWPEGKGWTGVWAFRGKVGYQPYVFSRGGSPGPWSHVVVSHAEAAAFGAGNPTSAASARARRP